MRGRRRVATLGMLALLAFATTLLASCGGGKASLSSAQPLSLAAASGGDFSVGDTLSELDALAPPEGVDTELFSSLKTELANLLALSGGKAANRVPKQHIEFLQPSVSLPSTRPPFTFGWNSSFFWADGSQDGVVTIQDLTPIAAHFGEAVEDTPQARVADYNRDGVVSIADLTPFAANLGVSVDRFEVGLVTMGTEDWILEEYPPERLAAISYSGSTGKDESGFNTWEFNVQAVPNQSMFWMSVTPVDAQGEEGTMCFLRATVSWSVPFQVNDLAIDPSAVPPDIGVTWTTAFFKGDGNQDSIIDIEDVTPLAAAIHVGGLTSEMPSITVADYDGNGIVNMGDLGVVSQYFNRNCDQFQVEVSATGPDYGYELNGSVGYGDSVEVNEYGFRAYRYTIADPPERPFWVRVTPYDWWDIPGIPSEPLEITE